MLRESELMSSLICAKDVCIDVLFLLGNISEAFELASKFVHFRGLLEACDYDSALLPNLYSLVSQHGSTVDPADGATPLGLYTLKHFERSSKLSAILEYSRIVENSQLLDFFGSRPQISWIYYVCRNSGDRPDDMTKAAEASLRYSQSQSNISKATALLSISKLSAVIAMSAESDCRSDIPEVEVLFQGACSNLAVIRAQEVAKEEGIIR